MSALPSTPVAGVNLPWPNAASSLPIRARVVRVMMFVPAVIPKPALLPMVIPPATFRLKTSSKALTSTVPVDTTTAPSSIRASVVSVIDTTFATPFRPPLLDLPPESPTDTFVVSVLASTSRADAFTNAPDSMTAVETASDCT